METKNVITVTTDIPNVEEDEARDEVDDLPPPPPMSLDDNNNNQEDGEDDMDDVMDAPPVSRDGALRLVQ